jgi:hypothetical protein
MDKMKAYNDLVKSFQSNVEFKEAEVAEVAVIPIDEEFEQYLENNSVIFKYKGRIYTENYSETYETPTHIITYSVCITNDERGDGMVFITDIKAK